MSLLMDALKKAELAKRQGQSGGTPDSAEQSGQGGLSLELVPDATAPAAAAQSAAPAGTLPQLPPHLEELDAQFLAEAEQAAAARLRAPPPAEPLRAPPAGPAGAAQAQPRAAAAADQPRTPAAPNAPQAKSAAQNLFAAKQAEKPAARKSFVVAIGVFTALSVSAIGGYFWWQLQPKSGLVANRAPSPVPMAATAPGAVPPAPTLAAPAVAPLAGAASHPASATADDEDDDAASGTVKQPTPPRRAAAVPVAAPATPESPVRVTRSPLKVNPVLLRGFDAFNRGDFATAQAEYERALKSDPRNTDALHGLAAIAVRQGRADEAERLYRQLAEADPHDTVALSALINMRGQIDPNAAESRLKILAAEQPELAAPHFSLGNLYARHGRWNDAQQAYFRAYNAEPDNPDIVYNLAISLEHLRQNKLAAQYYSQAIAAAQNRPAGFDKAQAAARLQTLQP